MYEKLISGSATVKYYLSDHPAISGFTWSPTQSWGSTWPFPIYAVALYLSTAVILRLLLRGRRVPLGLIPAVHSLAMCAISAVIFAGAAVSAAAEIRDTRWLWRRSRASPIQWLLCFPLGTRPSGRVFFWSHAFYLSRFPNLLRTFWKILRSGKLSPFELLNQSITVLTSFLWLEFSQSFQVPAILFTTLLHSAAYACRLFAELGFVSRARERGFLAGSQLALLCFNLLCHVAVMTLHFSKGGCNGIGAWACNSLLNALILSLFFKFYYLKITAYKSRCRTDIHNHDRQIVAEKHA